MSWFSIIFHFDKYLSTILNHYGALSYLFLFAVVFIETGLVVMPFLPGDSLLFVAGAFASNGDFNLFILFIVLTIAAILGDAVNYYLGSVMGKKFIHNNRFINAEYVNKTERFYTKYGKKAIIFARFVPIVRTFAPFIAGIGKMDRVQFTIFNVIGAISWVALFLLAGYFFGSIPIVERNLSIVILIIIFISIIPPIIELIRNRVKKNN